MSSLKSMINKSWLHHFLDSNQKNLLTWAHKNGVFKEYAKLGLFISPGSPISALCHHLCEHSDS